ncbi:hypothetical protein HMPREF0518_1831 [Lactobacillus helveticus DSM 20075 = CGMCC 1.1877]|nr:hypothetical protein HMPREF0518_1831 [Lactobacillus helveticus DSM 20075 = CGMCC 1.1877]
MLEFLYDLNNDNIIFLEKWSLMNLRHLEFFVTLAKNGTYGQSC